MNAQDVFKKAMISLTPDTFVLSAPNIINQIEGMLGEEYQSYYKIDKISSNKVHLYINGYLGCQDDDYKVIIGVEISNNLVKINLTNNKMEPRNWDEDKFYLADLLFDNTLFRERFINFLSAGVRISTFDNVKLVNMYRKQDKIINQLLPNLD